MKPKFGDKVEAIVERSAPSKADFGVTSSWKWEQWRDEKLIDVWEERNVCTTEGLTHILNVQFHGEAASATWYIALFEDDYTPLITNTYAVPGYTESTAYTEATRPAFVEAEAAAKTITNSANKADFTMNATKTIYGASLVDDNTKDDVAAAGAVLFCSSKFSAAKSVVSADVLKVTITITSSDM